MITPTKTLHRITPAQYVRSGNCSEEYNWKYRSGIENELKISSRICPVCRS